MPAHKSINSDTDVLLHMDKSRTWRFRATLVSGLERAYRWICTVTRLLLGILGVHLAPNRSGSIPKPMDGVVYRGL